jgi:multidrug efflux pump subunit AcrB
MPWSSAPREPFEVRPGSGGTAASSGATLTSTSNSGAIFSRLRPVEERVGTGDSLPRILAEAQERLEPEDISMLRTRNRSGAMVPLGSLTTFRSVSGPEYVTRYNLRPGAELNGRTAPAGPAAWPSLPMERLARETLPRGYDFEWTGLYFQQILNWNTAVYVFPLCVWFVWPSNESRSLPLMIILIVPRSSACS